jgi:hypothetical protein
MRTEEDVNVTPCMWSCRVKEEPTEKKKAITALLCST